tara:strand:+ start:6866 stop:7117 length:252 start_codon:yes stop_codon:yes gene_type:complete
MSLRRVCVNNCRNQRSSDEEFRRYLIVKHIRKHYGVIIDHVYIYGNIYYVPIEGFMTTIIKIGTVNVTIAEQDFYVPVMTDST